MMYELEREALDRLHNRQLSVGEFIALYEQAQDYVVARAKEAGQIPPWARSDEVIFEFGRRVEKRVRERQEVSREVCGNEL